MEHARKCDSITIVILKKKKKKTNNENVMEDYRDEAKVH